MQLAAPQPVGNGPHQPESPCEPRRLVLLEDAEASEIVEILADFTGDQARSTPIHEEVRRFAAEHPGRQVAAEWLGKTGWNRFLWCRSGGESQNTR